MLSHSGSCQHKALPRRHVQVQPDEQKQTKGLLWLRLTVRIILHRTLCSCQGFCLPEVLLYYWERHLAFVSISSALM